MDSHRTQANMSDTRDTSSETSDDLSALAWVQEELRRSLETAHKALRRFVKESEAVSGADVDAVDPSVLRTARQQIHQGVGALELVGLPMAASVLRASEAAVHRFSLKPQKITSAEIDVIEQASFALLDYLQRMLAGKSLPALALFPRYREVQVLAGADRVHPADLWTVDWQWRALPAEPGVAPREPNAEARGLLEQQMLLLMRGQQLPATARMSELCASLGQGASDLPASTLWKLAAAFFESQAQGILQSDVFSKRVASRLLAQLRTFERGDTDVSERLAQDLLFFCAQSVPSDTQQAPRLVAARLAYGLQRHVPVNYELNRLGRFDPAMLAQAKKRVSAAKDTWSGVAGGELHRLGSLSEQFSLVGDSVKRLYPSGELLADELMQVMAQTQQAGAAPATELAMEVATSVLYLESSLEEADFDHPEQAQRVRRLAQRIAGVRAGQMDEPIEAWMEELYRRVSDRQTMGSMVQELRNSLADVEQHVDQFFRNPKAKEPLLAVPTQLSAMRGALSVLGLDTASQAVLRMRDEIEGLVSTEVDPAQVVESGTLERLANNLSALGFLINMLGVQPQLTKSLFVFDPRTGVLSPMMGRTAAARDATKLSVPQVGTVEPRLIEQAQSLADSAVSARVPLDEVSRDLERLSEQAHMADQHGLLDTVSQAQAALEKAADASQVTSAREQLSEALVDFVASTSDPVVLDELDAPAAQEAEADLPSIVHAEQPPAVAQAAAPASAPASAPAPATSAPTAVDDAGDLGDDPEMREIFLEEARGEVEKARDALQQLARVPGDLEQLTSVRRTFHTFKGSSRMVGLKEFGEGSWACEQVYNTWMAGQSPASPELLDFTAQAVTYLSDWVEAIAAQRAGAYRARPLVAAAEAFGRGEAWLAIQPAAPQAEPELERVALNLAEPEPEIEAAELPVMAALAAAAPPERQPELSFELNLSALDDEPAAVSIPAAASDANAQQAAALLPSQATAMPVDDGVELIEIDFDEAFGADVLSPIATAAAVELAEAPLPVLETLSAPEVIEDTQVTWPEVESAFTEPDATAAVVDVAPASAEAELPTEPEPTEPEPAEPELDHAEPLGAEASSDQVKVIGPLHISIPLFNIYLNEADEISRRLTTEVAEWAMELHRPVGEMPIAHAHSLAGSSATVGFADLSHLARLLEHALMRTQAIGHGTPEEARLFVDAAEEIRRLLHQFAAGFLKAPAPELLERLAAHEIDSAHRLEVVSAAVDLPAPDALEDAPAFTQNASENVPAAESSAAAAVPAALAQLDPNTTAVTDTSFGGLHTEPAGLGYAELKAFTPLAATDQPVSLSLRSDAPDELDADDIDAVDAVDAELFPIFEEEADELLPALAASLREWARRPADNTPAASCMRTLHTLKGGARLAGAMRLGEMAHRLEARIEHLLAQPAVVAAEVQALESHADALAATLDALRSRDEQAYADAATALANAPATVDVVLAAAPQSVAAIDAPLQALAPVVQPSAPAVVIEPEATAIAAPAAPAAPAVRAASEPAAPTEIDWSRFAADPNAPVAAAVDRNSGAANAAVRVRGPLLERMVNQAGEVSIARARIEAEVGNIRGSLGDLTDNLERLRQQLRDIEFQAETQMISRQDAARAAHESFDPLESDRFTRFQELTRMMAESVNDVATVQRTLQRTLETTEDELAAQARLTRDLQDDLLRTRMVEFESQSDRLYRVVRQAAKETGKQVRLDIVGGSIEMDRGVLDRMTPAFEHLLRNCVTHGIESAEARASAGKDPVGSIAIVVRQEGNEVAVEFRDDGAGLNLPRIRAKGIAAKLLDETAEHSDGELANLIFTAGFSTAETVTELAGRGVGMDVVRSEVNAMGGRIETATAAGQGTSFKLVLPLTTAVTQVVMLRCGKTVVAVPATLIEIVRRAKADELEQCYQAGTYTLGDRSMLLFWFGALLQQSPISHETGRTRHVIVVRSAQQRIALHIDEVLGTQEVVVKNLGPQLSRLPGLAGMTLLASGAVALIYNPVALATLYGEAARAATYAARVAPTSEQASAATQEEQLVTAPLILVVDDSLTVRRVTQRLLVREGYRVVLAKDGIEALERLAGERPQVVLSDIEMPRMDGFDLARNIRSDERLRDLPIIMITSRIAQKHRDYAGQLGVDHYLGKPYAEEDLLALIGRYIQHATAPA